MQEFGIYITGATLLALIATVAGVVRKFSHVEERVDAEIRVRETMEAQIENMERELVRVERDGLQRTENVRQETGEVGAAIRQRIHDVEIGMRDRMDLLSAGIRDSIDKLGDRLEEKIDRIKYRDN